MSEPTIALSHRAAALLRAVRAGRVDMTCGSEPDMFVDGLNCCDQPTAHALFHQGLVRPARLGSITEHVRAELTDAGHDVLGSEPKVTAA
ncbi:hypothetical protein SAMN05192558_110176 [Actinokineospora alba]|uniref:Uncharacterized protein n=1 Tax=Actinokineospora alba TaxID=504798 RepID=A0A1H0TT27_9PSEU|nr:hypothetical protein [Actinokineospora alba]TDP70697.1 hypothetical protein C8E96_6325 [Actinokineospora alba]SDJ14004.1 hypothetical protein SAMN05421871_110176 [Actinokineospora alba]SDP57093.1 hypothetical protein SAMN05192558_110176 [Actinokineospora alba]